MYLNMRVSLIGKGLPNGVTDLNHLEVMEINFLKCQI
jgi:hypothetical protein